LNARLARAAAVTLAGFTTFLNLYTPQPILPLIAEGLGVAEAATAATVTASLVAVALLAPFAGAISDRIGRKRLIAGACMVLAVPTLLAATAQSLEALLLWRFLQGLAMPFIFTVAVAYIGEETEGAEAIRLAGIYGVGTILGGFGGRAVAGLAAELAGWRAGFAVIGVFTLAAGLAVAVLLPAEQRFRAQLGGLRAHLATWRDHLGNARLMATCVIGFLMLFGNVAVYTFVTLHLAAPPFGLSPAAMAGVFAVYLVGAATTAGATALTVRFGRPVTVVLVAALAATGLVLTLVPSLVAIVAGLAMVSGGLLVVQNLSLGFLGVAVSQGRSAAVGMYVTTYYVGGALGGLVPAVAWQAAGWRGVVAVVLPAIVALGALGWRFWGRGATGR
jgi:predicted MFS family arabinose efflux permease